MAASHVHVLYIGHHAPGRHWQIAPHSHPYYEMLVIVRDLEHITVGAHALTARAGTVVLFPPGCVHAERCDGVHALESFYWGFMARGIDSTWPLSVDDHAGRLRQLAAWLYAERDNRQPAADAARRAYATAVVHEYHRLAQATTAPLVEATRAYVRAHLDTPLDLAHLARHAGLSKFHFARAYQALAGRSPMADLRALRLAHARDLILTTPLPLKAVAAACGLGDGAALARMFRRDLHTTPSQLRVRPTARR